MFLIYLIKSKQFSENLKSATHEIFKKTVKIFKITFKTHDIQNQGIVWKKLVAHDKIVKLKKKEKNKKIT